MLQSGFQGGTGTQGSKTRRCGDPRSLQYSLSPTHGMPTVTIS